MEPPEKKEYSLIAVITDNPKAWEITATDDAESIQLVIPIRKKFTRKDLDFLNANLQKVLEHQARTSNKA